MWHRSTVADILGDTGNERCPPGVVPGKVEAMEANREWMLTARLIRERLSDPATEWNESTRAFMERLAEKYATHARPEGGR